MANAVKGMPAVQRTSWAVAWSIRTQTASHTTLPRMARTPRYLGSSQATAYILCRPREKLVADAIATSTLTVLVPVPCPAPPVTWWSCSSGTPITSCTWSRPSAPMRPDATPRTISRGIRASSAWAPVARERSTSSTRDSSAHTSRIGCSDRATAGCPVRARSHHADHPGVEPVLTRRSS